MEYFNFLLLANLNLAALMSLMSHDAFIIVLWFLVWFTQD